MQAYHFLPACYAVEDIEKRRMKISTIGDLNDPFELLAIDLSDEDMRHDSLQAKDYVTTQIGVLCFSKFWSNPVLWSHYADKHRGVCLGFEVSDDKIMHIKYETNRLITDMRSVLARKNRDEMREIMGRILNTKYRDWQHEDEVRVHVKLVYKDARNMYFKNFDDALVLKEVVLGARYEGDIKEMEALVTGYNNEVKVVRASLAFESFKIVPLS